MAKITRVFQKLFGSASGTDQVAQFGSLFAGTSTFTTDPATIQGLSNWLTGWFAAAIGGNAPAIEDMNAFCLVVCYQLAYLMQTGVPEWDTSTTYYIGSLANDGSGNLYVSLTDNNQGNTLSNNLNWRRTTGIVSSKTANYTATPNDSFIRVNTTSAAFTITLPLSSAMKPGIPIYFKKTDSSANACTIKAAGTDQIDDATTYDMTVDNEALTIIPDGNSNWSILG